MPTKVSLFLCSINLYFSKEIREEKKKGAIVHFFKKNKTFDKSELQLLTAITFDSVIEKTIILYQTENSIDSNNMSFPRSGE